MQYSSANGSQGGSGVLVIVGVMDGVAVGARVVNVIVGVVEAILGDGAVFVGMTFVFTRTTGVSVTPVVVQVTRINNKRKLNIGFIRTEQSSGP